MSGTVCTCWKRFLPGTGFTIWKERTGMNKKLQAQERVIPCDYTGKMVSKWEINSTSAVLFQHITKKYKTSFFLFNFFHGLGINKPWSHWQIPAKDHRECVLLNVSPLPNLCLPPNPQYYCADNFFPCGFHTWKRGQIVWTIFLSSMW